MNERISDSPLVANSIWNNNYSQNMYIGNTIRLVKHNEIMQTDIIYGEKTTQRCGPNIWKHNYTYIVELKRVNIQARCV